MSLNYAAEHLSAAVRSLASSQEPFPDRLQTAWDDHVQMVWMKRCLPRDLLREFRDLWERYTAPSDNPHSTQLRALGADDCVTAVEETVALCLRTVSAAAVATGDEEMATIADLGEG